MGGCAGKNKSKRAKTYESNNSVDQSRTKAEFLQNCPLPNGSSETNANETTTDDEENVQTMTNQFDGINQAISQIFSSRVIAISDSELECELANLIYGNPERDYAENPLVARKFKSTEV